MSDYKVTKTGENEYKVEKESDWSSDDLEGTSFCIVCGKRLVPLWEGDRCCSLDCKRKYDENEEYYDEKEKSGTFFSCFVFLALLAFFVYCAVTCVNEAKNSWMFSNRECFYEQECEGCDSSRFLQDVQVHTGTIRCALNLSTQLQFNGLQEPQQPHGSKCSKSPSLKENKS